MAHCWCGSGLPYEDCHKQSDLRLEALRKKGERTPPRTLVKSAPQIEGIRKACRANSLVLDAVAEKIRVGMTTGEIDRIVDSVTRSLGGIPAPLNYEGFPKSVCTSVNDVICHGIPDDRTVLREGDIVNVDCTTILDGYYGDASRMFTFGSLAPNAEKLVRVTKEAVKLAVEHLYPFCHLGDVGFYIDRHARKNGFSVVREIGGHGCGLQMHEEPYVCHIGKKGKGMVLVPGMIFTIEPMINEGSPLFTVDKTDGWQVRTIDRGLSAQVEHMVLITEEGYEILSA
ncbi:MAG: type I methionyl aminopeptidase [Clostridia bacterium]|nr:type I methionyl aminopeptidase [Clostridia bacterium]